MYVKLIGPGDGQESEHRVDAASAVLLVNQLREEPGPGRLITVDDETYFWNDARAKFYTEGETLTAQVSVVLVKAGK